MSETLVHILGWVLAIVSFLGIVLNGQGHLWNKKTWWWRLIIELVLVAACFYGLYLG